MWRATIVAGQTLVTDALANSMGSAGSALVQVGCRLARQPSCAGLLAAGYVVGATVTSALGDHFWAEFNSGFFPQNGLGEYPLSKIKT